MITTNRRKWYIKKASPDTEMMMVKGGDLKAKRVTFGRLWTMMRRCSRRCRGYCCLTAVGSTKPNYNNITHFRVPVLNVLSGIDWFTHYQRGYYRKNTNKKHTPSTRDTMRMDLGNNSNNKTKIRKWNEICRQLKSHYGILIRGRYRFKIFFNKKN